MIKEKLLGFESSTEDIIKFICLETNKEMSKNYVTLKEGLVEILRRKEKNKLEEELEVYKYKKIALESTNPENLTIGMVSILAILATLFGIMVSTEESIGFLYIAVIVIIFFIVLIFSILLLTNRIKEKSKKVIYYNIMVEVIEKALIKKALEEKNEGFKEYNIKIREVD